MTRNIKISITSLLFLPFIFPMSSSYASEGEGITVVDDTRFVIVTLYKNIFSGKEDRQIDDVCSQINDRLLAEAMEFGLIYPNNTKDYETLITDNYTNVMDTMYYINELGFDIWVNGGWVIYGKGVKQQRILQIEIWDLEELDSIKKIKYKASDISVKSVAEEIHKAIKDHKKTGKLPKTNTSSIDEDFWRLHKDLCKDNNLVKAGVLQANDDGHRLLLEALELRENVHIPRILLTCETASKAGNQLIQSVQAAWKHKIEQHGLLLTQNSEKADYSIKLVLSVAAATGFSKSIKSITGSVDLKNTAGRLIYTRKKNLFFAGNSSSPSSEVQLNVLVDAFDREVFASIKQIYEKEKLEATLGEVSFD